MSIVGKRIEIESETLFPQLTGQQGYCLGELPGSEPLCYRVALDNGQVGDFPGVVLYAVESDVTEELTRPLPPAVTNEREQQTASIMLARIHQLKLNNAEKIVEIEAEIKAEQARVAARIRAEHAELYESQRVTAIVYSTHEERVKAGAESVWQAAGSPTKGKTFGAAQIAEEWALITFDPDAALAYARTQAPNMIETRVDPDRFKKAVRDGILKDVPEEACKWEKGYTIKTLAAKLNALAYAPVPPSEPESA